MATREPVPFGALLVRHRAAARLTQEQLAERAGLSVDAVAALERGKRRTPHAATAELLANALGLSEQQRAQFVAAARSTGGTRPPPRPRVVDATGEAVRDAPPADGLGRLRWELAAYEPTPLVGRAQELDTILRLLIAGGGRLLTLVGPAGVGKTRLALEAVARLAESPEAAERFPDGVIFVDLAPVRAPAQVLDAIARALGLLDVGGRPVLERLVDALDGRRLLVVLDNFEQVLPAAPDLAQLLTACPHLHLLVTSRVPLRLRREGTLRIAPLPVPDPNGLPLSPEELIAVPSIALFVERARAHRADFVFGEQQAPDVARLATKLDGLPLALELAAARLDVLPLSTVAGHLEDRLHLLRWEAADAPERQRSLEAAVGWSYDLLPEDEQRVFRCLGVFVGYISLAAITSVAGGIATLDVLLSLAEKSLVLPGPGTDPGDEDGEWGSDEDAEEEAEFGFRMLETVREYARMQLIRCGELEDAHRAHARYFVALAERGDPHLRGRDQRAWFLRLERKHDNLRAALRWLLDQEDEGERTAGLRLAAALGYFWWLRGYHSEGSSWIEEALARAPHDVEADPAAATAHTAALCWSGMLLTLRREPGRARTRLEEALACARKRHDSSSVARALTFLGHCALYGGEAEREHAAPLLQEALRTARAAGEPHDIVVALFFLGVEAHARGHATEAAAYFDAALDFVEAAGDARAAQIKVGLSVCLRDDPSTAAGHLREALETGRSQRDRWLLSLGARAALVVLGERADPVGYARLAGASDALRQATGGGRVPWEPAGAGQRAAARRAQLTEREWDTNYREGQALHAGEVVRLAVRLLEEVVGSPPRPRAALDAASRALAHSVAGPLTEREQEVLRLVAEGLSSKAIGRRLAISPSTVNQHVTAIFNKLGADTRAQAVAVAAQRGLL